MREWKCVWNSRKCDAELYFEERDIDSFLDKLEHSVHEVKYLNPCKADGSGRRVIRMYDPDGHVIEIGEPIKRGSIQQNLLRQVQNLLGQGFLSVRRFLFFALRKGKNMFLDNAICATNKSASKKENYMKLTTLCYIEKEDKYLMLHRIKKENDVNHDKWIGVGGKFEAGEMPEECLLREVYEETGLTLTKYRFRGIITFVLNEGETEYMHLFTATEYEGELTNQSMAECDEGELVWVPKSEIENLEIWEGDKIFLRLLREDAEFFSLKLRYEGDSLVETRVER